MQALTRTEVNFTGKHYQFANVPIEMKPAQLPHPPLWYAVPVPEGAAWPAQKAINIVCGGPLPRVREITDRYRAEWAAAGNSPDQLPLLGHQPLRASRPTAIARRWRSAAVPGRHSTRAS